METAAPLDGQAVMVGEMFLVEYYQFASGDNANVSKFYRKNAICSFGDASQVVGPAKIAEKLAVLDGARFDLETGGVTCSFQSTADGNILVMVSGLVSLRGADGNYAHPRRFVQTFLLVQKDPHTYAIANDMHRFVETTSDSKSTATPAPAAASPAVSAAPAPVPVSNGQVAKEESKHVQAEVEKPVTAEPKPEPKVSPAPAKVETPAAPAAPAAAVPTQVAASKERQPRPPKAAGTSNQSAAQPPVAEKKETAPPKPSGPPSYSQVAASKSSPKPVQAAAPVASNGVKEKPVAVAEKPAEAPKERPASPPAGTAVFVKNGQSVSQKSLTDALGTFGPVQNVSIRGTAAIVTFADIKEAENAVAAKEISVEGTVIVLEMYRGSSGRSGGQRRGGGGSSAAATGSERRPQVGAQGGAPRQPRPAGTDGKPGGQAQKPRPAASSKPTGGPRGGQGNKSAATPAQ